MKTEKDNLIKENQTLKDINSTLKIENDNLKIEKDKLIKENQTLKDRHKTLEIENDNLKINLDKLNLIKDNEIKKINDQYKILNEEKVKIIEDLQSKLKKNAVDTIKYIELPDEEKFIAVNFISVDQKINLSIICNKKKKFHEIENQLYEKYPEYSDGDNYFMFDGNKIKRFKTLEENGITGYTIILQKIDDE